MLELIVYGHSTYDEDKNEFILFEEKTITIEHSLYSISKWEEKYHRPFLSIDDTKTSEEIIDYIRMMCVDNALKNDDLFYMYMEDNAIDKIHEYMSNSATATTFSDERSNANRRKIITAEIIYYSMIRNQIPLECQYWHINKLQTLLHVCAVKDNPPKKRSKKQIMQRNAAINASRRLKMNSSG